jgi:hypothetical protein
MGTYVEGIKPPDEKWKKMKAIWDSCNEAGVNIPKEVDTFFGGVDPDALGVVVGKDGLGKAIKEYHSPTGDSEGCEIFIDKLPRDVKIVRVVNSY